MSKSCCAGYKLATIVGINKVPRHWEEKEIKYCLQDGSEGIKIGPFGSALKSEMLVENGYKVYGQENLIKDSFEIGHRFITEEKFRELDVYEIRPGNVLISMMGTIGKCKVVPKDIQRGIMDSHLIRLSFDESVVLSEFAALLIQEAFYINVQLGVNSKGSIMAGLNSSIIKNLKVLIPTLEEQKLILQYLNMKTRQLDGLIQNKHDLITLLEEQCQSMITEAVTKGLNPNVKMKDSGVEWIGEIPEHWEKVKLKHLTRMKSGESIDALDIKPEGEYKVYGGGGFRGYTSKYTHAGEYVLIGRQGALCGNVTFASGEFWATEHAVVVEVNYIDIRFLRYLLECMNLNQYSISAAQPGLSVSTILNLTVPVPTKNEQVEIAAKLEDINVQTVQLVSDIQSQIQQLKEYRQSLIYEAVTGKIDVRDFEVKA